jgi:hypothetical protein
MQLLGFSQLPKLMEDHLGITAESMDSPENSEERPWFGPKLLGMLQAV